MAWVYPLREPPRAGEKLLIECDSCSGKLILSSDGMGRITVEAPTASVLLANFSSWLNQAAAESGLSAKMVANEVGQPWLKTGPPAGCPHCLAARPETNVASLNHVASGAVWDELYQCPKCGAYRWKTFETHGFAELDVWGDATRDDLGQFKRYLEEESRKRAVTQEQLLEEIFQKCV